MKKGVATPERNSGEKLVLVVRTRTPLEAYNMLKAGQPVDQAIGWYQQQTEDVNPQDLFMMDTPQKLRYINELKERVAIQKSDVESITNEVKQSINNKILTNEQTSKGTDTGTTVSEPGNTGSDRGEKNQ